ncbi:MAG TPA: ABC transporter ATP-binding protein [Candidatus Saccharimonadales bacterium]|nr:ABC transporter ATP-binding protein [Candidatus Saccharimonadales bacterium]
MTKKKHSVDWLTLRHFWEVSSHYKKDFILSWFTVVSAVCITIVVPYIIGKILAALAVPGAPVNHYIYALGIVGIIAVISNRIAFTALFRLQPKVMADLARESLTVLLHRGASFHNNRVSGKLVSDASDYPKAYDQLSNVIFIDILQFVFIVVLGIVLVARDSMLIGMIILTMTGLAIYSSLRFRNRMTPFRLKRHAAGKDVTSHMADVIVNNATVKSFGNEEKELAEHTRLSNIFKVLRTHDWLELAKNGSYRIFSLLLFQLIFIIVVVQQVRENPDLLATGIFAFSYTMTLSNRLFQIGIMARQLEEALLLAMPMTEMLQEDIEIKDRPGAVALKVTDGRIVFEKVTFHYADNPKHESVFSGLDLNIRSGEKIGLVGPSGGGKTTLTKLLLRFEDIQDGTIRIDGQDIAGVTQQSLRKSIAYVPQEPLLFHRTIRENIAYGKSEATDSDVQHAARQAYAHDFIMKLPGGYDTVVGERGVKLSGGQRQRVAIARTILKDAPILVLDEATSALDSESEQAIQSALWKLMQDRTAVVVAHRLSTIQRMDRILVLDGGTIVEQGSHKELLAKDSLYARLWKHQSGGFIEE